MVLDDLAASNLQEMLKELQKVDAAVKMLILDVHLELFEHFSEELYNI